jgi:hypothetical protein
MTPVATLSFMEMQHRWQSVLDVAKTSVFMRSFVPSLDGSETVYLDEISRQSGQLDEQIRDLWQFNLAPRLADLLVSVQESLDMINVELGYLKIRLIGSVRFDQSPTLHRSDFTSLTDEQAYKLQEAENERIKIIGYLTQVTAEFQMSAPNFNYVAARKFHSVHQ